MLRRLIAVPQGILIGVLALSFSLGMLGCPKSANAQGEAAYKLVVAPLGFTEDTGRNLLGLGRGADILRAKLSRIRNVDLVSQEDVESTLGGEKLNKDTALSIGKALNADIVAYGVVSQLQFFEKQQATVRVELYLYGAGEGVLLSRSVSTGDSGANPGFSGDLSQLAQLAIRNGVERAVDDSFSNLARYGVVTVIRGDEVDMNLSQREGLAPGSQVAIIRNYEQIALVEVTESGIAHSVGRVTWLKGGEVIKATDRARVLFNPEPVARTAQSTNIKRGKKLSPVTLGLIAIGVIAAATSKGKDHAEAPRGTSSAMQFVASSDARAAIYSDKGFHPDYIPNPPTRITDISTSGLAACYNAACNNNTDTCAVAATAYNFSLATNPRDPNFPAGYNYTMGLTVDGLGLTDSEKQRAHIATCNTSTGKWQIVSGSGYYSITYPNYGTVTGVLGTVAHFSPYVVVISAPSSSPFAAPSGFSVLCGDSSLTLVWNCSTDPQAAGYNVYSCAAGGSCTSLIETISTPNTCTRTYTGLTNDVSVCYGVDVNPTAGVTRSSNLSGPKCGTPSTNCTGVVRLISPDNNSEITSATPNFIWTGTGDSDFYILTVKKLDNSQVVYTKNVSGEGAPAPGASATTPVPQMFTDTYAGSTLAKDSKYTWQVSGYQNVSSVPVLSPTWTFTEKGGGAEEQSNACSPDDVLDPPLLVNPPNGTQLQVATPIFQWGKVTGATKYILTITNQDGAMVCQKLVTSGTSADYSSCLALVDNIQYFWTVQSANECVTSARATPFSFLKMPSSVTTTLAAPVWYSLATDGKEPISSPASQLVVLRWHPVGSASDTTVAGYIVYRCTTAVCDPNSDTLAVILKEQLSAPSSNPFCPNTFSAQTPGFCDVSATDGTKYYYQVAAINQGQQPGQISVAQSITLSLQKPVLIAPGGAVASDITTAAPTLMWNTVNGATSYVVTVRECGSSQSPCLGTVIWQTTVTDTLVNFGGSALTDLKVYGWKVRALNSIVQSEDSQEFYFTKKPSTTLPPAPNWCGGTYCSPWALPDTFTTDLSDSSIKIYWQKVGIAAGDPSNITQYIIYRSNSPTGVCESAANEYTRVGQYNCDAFSKVVCFKDTYLDRGADYYYAIKAVDSGGQSSLCSSVIKITLNFNGPTLLEPNNDIVVYNAKPFFKWLPEKGAALYRLELVKTSPTNFGSQANTTWTATLEPEGTENILQLQFGVDPPAPAKPLENPLDPNSSNAYFWRVCSSNKVDASRDKCATAFRFYKALRRPETIQPSASSLVTVDRPLFTWTAVPGAVGYTVRLCEGYYPSSSGVTGGCSSDAQGTPPKIVGIQNVEDTEATFADVVLQNCNVQTNPDPNVCTYGNYTWDVRAYDEMGQTSGDWTYQSSQTFIKVNVQAPFLITPTDEQVIGPDPTAALGTDFYGNTTYNYKVFFTWNPVTAATGYKIRVEDLGAEAATGTSIIVWQDVTSGGTTAYNANAGGGTNVIPFSAGTVYRWNVASLDAPFIDTNSRKFRTGLPQPNLLSPDDGKQVVLSSGCDDLSAAVCVHFEWATVYGAKAYEIEIVDSEGYYYKCEKNYDPTTQGGGVVRTLINQTTCDLSTPDPARVINLTFQWRVRARDGDTTKTIDGFNGYPSPWSQYRSFNVFVPGPKLSSPTNSNPTCDPVGDPDNIWTKCTTVACQNPTFWWSPIPTAPVVCYKLEVSDTSDFRNPIVVSDTLNAPTSGWKKDVNNNYNGFEMPLSNDATYGVTAYGVLVNGVRYYWRVGAGVAPTPTDPCGSKWIFSDVYSFVRRPGKPINVAVTAVTADTVTLAWQPPTQCGGTPVADNTMAPRYPDKSGGFILYEETNMPSPASPPVNRLPLISNPSSLGAVVSFLSESTKYVFCVETYDESENTFHPGHISDPACVAVTTPAKPTTP